ncbi:hypothetical protein AB0L82_10700 [Nocardia sp. NPDC052001]|uniref:phthiocerol/phthiodiolone dimycocerosyl transferase family protein n=1 Tax=Nocardia sp. NPDC052001 TaxID=3154853 RepID=UPI00341A1412
MSVGRIRSLAPSERVFALVGAYIGYRVRVRGELDIAALATAFAGLRQRYPVLAAVLEPEDEGHAIVARPGPLPGVVVSAGDLDAPVSGACVDQEHALSGLHVVLDGDRAAVTLFTHHSIADGYHSLELLGDLWSLYTAAVRGEQVDLTPWDYPESLEQVLADRGIVKADNDIAEPAASPASPDAPVRPSRTPDATRVYTVAATRCRLDAVVTAGLLAYAREQETTLNGVVSALILRVESEQGGVPAERFEYSYPVDLRNRISPPVANPAATDPLGFVNFTPTGDLGNTAEVARAVTDDLRKGLDSGEVHQAGLRFFDTMTAAVARLGQVPASERPVGIVSSNWGVVPTPRIPEQLEFEDFQSMMFEHRVAPDSPFKPPNTYVLSTFQGRLAIELRTPIAPDEARNRLAAIESALRALGGA